MVREREVLCVRSSSYIVLSFSVCVCSFSVCVCSFSVFYHSRGNIVPFCFYCSPLFSPLPLTHSHTICLSFSPPPHSQTYYPSLCSISPTPSDCLSVHSLTHKKLYPIHTHTLSLSLSLSLWNTHAQTDLSGLQSCRRD